jgi:conjugative transposon TraN protein
MRTLVNILAALLLQLSIHAQNYIHISESKATHLICPEKVTYLQVGDPARIMAEVVPEHPSLVRIKAAEPFEGETSLTLVCGGKVYSLLAGYQNTGQVNYHLKSFRGDDSVISSEGKVPEYVLKELGNQILSKKANHIRNRKSKKEGMQLRLNNIWLSNDLLFFEVSITNKTNIGYRVEGFNWWIDDKKQLKATNVQEYPVLPQSQHYGVSYVPAGTTLREVFVLSKLTIPDKRVLRIEMLEKALGNTGRKLSLEIKNRDILSARKLK